MWGNSYDNSNNKLPLYYNKPGPDSYLPDNTIVTDSYLEKIAYKNKSPGIIIGKEDFPND